MAQARSAASTLTRPRVQVIAPVHIGETALAALRARGIDAQLEANGTNVALAADHIVAWALDAIPTASTAVELATVCERAAASPAAGSTSEPARVTFVTARSASVCFGRF